MSDYKRSYLFIPTERDEIIASSKYFYGSESNDDFMFRNPVSLPLFGSLARKALYHYVGDLYDPHTIDISIEGSIRLFLYREIRHKVFHRLPDYDWEYIDHMFRKAIGNMFGMDLKHDQARIDQGRNDPYSKSYQNDLSISDD